MRCRARCCRHQSLHRPLRPTERGALGHAHAACAMHVHAYHHIPTLTNSTTTGRTLHQPRAYTPPDACELTCRTRRRPGRREAAARPPPSAAKVAAAVPGRAIAAAAGRCTAAPAAADRSTVSPSMGGVCAERRPHASACRAAAQPHRLRRSRAPSQGCDRAAAPGAPQVPGLA